ncbi:UNVERIFIED_CONTAM: hypothetical protein K2H54_028003 [Gekko kuhli]
MTASFRTIAMAPFLTEVLTTPWTPPVTPPWQNRDTTVITNLISVHCDESQWKYPHEFNPSNFLNEKGEFEKPEAFLAFSAGPRGCLGENLARIELFLFFTNILRRFQILWPDETKAPDLRPNFGVTLSPSSFKVALKCRQPNLNSTKWDWNN